MDLTFFITFLGLLVQWAQGGNGTASGQGQGGAAPNGTQAQGGQQPPVFWLGMHYRNTSGTIQNVSWTDGSAVDFGNPTMREFQVAQFFNFLKFF